MTDRYELVELPWVDGRKYWLKDTETGWRYTMDLILADHLNEAVAARDAEIARLNEKVTRTVIGHNDCANELIGTREENEQLKAQLEKARKHLTDIKQPGDLVPQIEKAIAVLEIGG